MTSDVLRLMSPTRRDGEELDSYLRVTKPYTLSCTPLGEVLWAVF